MFPTKLVYLDMKQGGNMTYLHVSNRVSNQFKQLHHELCALACQYVMPGYPYIIIYFYTLKCWEILPQPGLFGSQFQKMVGGLF